MLLPRFDFHRPTSIAETCAILDEYGDSASLVAGGTDVLVNLRRKRFAPSQLVGIDRGSDLASADSDDSGWNIEAVESQHNEVNEDE